MDNLFLLVVPNPGSTVIGKGVVDSDSPTALSFAWYCDPECKSAFVSSRAVARSDRALPLVSPCLCDCARLRCSRDGGEGHLVSFLLDETPCHFIWGQWSGVIIRIAILFLFTAFFYHVYDSQVR